MREHDYFVYILTNARRSVLYTGVTNDLARRLHEHRQAGAGAGATNTFAGRYRAGVLVWFEHFRSIGDAIACEKRIKGWTVAKKRALIGTQNARWLDLGADVLPGALG